MKRVENLYNSKYAQKYRRVDETIKENVDFLILKDFLLSFFEKTLIDLRKKSLDVLDLGCGTGRYFHIFDGKLVNRLVGIDISKPMIDIAKNSPPFKEEISVKNIELINKDFMKVNNIGKFDFVYSIGVLGEHSPFNKKVATKIATEFLNSGGRFIFTNVCWWHKEPWKRTIHTVCNKLGISYFLYEIGILYGFYNTDISIIKSIQERFELEELKFWNKEYPHYLVCAKRK